MIYLYIGTDREKARQKMNAAVKKGDGSVVRITDANSIHDLKAALQGGGMFAEARTLVFENVCTVDEMSEELLRALPQLAATKELVFIYEEKPLADLKKRLEKHAERSEKFDAPKKGRDTGIFDLADALRSANKKKLWVSYMKEIAKGTPPEAIHGVLFWGVKDAFLKGGEKDARIRGFIAELAALPHEARRRGEDLEYALERFVLCV